MTKQEQLQRDINIINETFKRTEKGIYSMRRTVREMANRSELKEIAEIIETLSIEKYDEFLKKYARGKYGIVISEPTKIEKLPYKKAMELLRKNTKSLLWNKNIRDWSYSDWIELRSY